MKILMQNRINVFSAPGGDTIQMLKTKEYLERIGCEVSIACDLNPDLKGIDLVHLFNITRINETYMQFKNAQKQNKPVARACGLGLFGDVSRFIAGGRGVGYPDLALRGVRNVAEGDAPKIANPILDAYNAILGADPGQALKAMTPEIATGLSGLLQMYKPQKQ